MAIVLGTNSGFVASSASGSGDPGGTGTIVIDGRKVVTHDVSPATAVKITEVGWYCIEASEESNFEVGLYAADGATVPGEAGTRLFVDATNAKGTGAGWKAVTGLDWAIDPSTDYWIGVQLDNVATATNLRRNLAGGTGQDNIAGTSLTNPFGGGAIADADGMLAVYAVWEAAAAGGTNLQINVGDAWKEVSAAQINIGDSWKDAAGAQINIGDAWKTIF